MWRRVASLSPVLSSQVSHGLRIGRTFSTEVSNSVGGTVLEKKAPFITFVLGGPGCGKGTQCAKIAETFGFKHIISADLLKKLILSNTEESSMVRKRIMEGKFAASIETVQLIQKEMESSEIDKFLIDGFPRSEENRVAFEKMVSEPDMVIYLDCTQEEMVERAVNKKEGEFVIDEEDTVMKRIELFERNCLPVINYYSKTGKLHEIDGDGTVEEVFKRVREVFTEFVGTTFHERQLNETQLFHLSRMGQDSGIHVL